MKRNRNKVKNKKYRVSDDHVRSSHFECLKKDIQEITEYKNLDSSMNKYILGEDMVRNEDLNDFDHIEEGFL
jgi:uridine kinase